MKNGMASSSAVSPGAPSRELPQLKRGQLSKVLSEAMPKEVSFVVPYVPPSVNHYVKHTRNGRHYVTKEASAFLDAVYVFAARRKVLAKEYELDVTVYFGKGQKGDGDNLWKVIGDGLKKANVIHSDAAVKRWVMNVDRDWARPRTEITVRAM